MSNPNFDQRQESAIYPQHDQLLKTATERQAIVCFIDWLEERNIELVNTWDDYTKDIAYAEDWGRLYREGLKRQLAEYFEIDLQALQAEKDLMLKRAAEQTMAAMDAHADAQRRET
jgi:hypothetical protein